MEKYLFNIYIYIYIYIYICALFSRTCESDAKVDDIHLNEE